MRKIENLKSLFSPSSIAVIGASSREGSLGRATFANILFNGFNGIVYPVNIRAKSVLGVKAYPSVTNIPDPIDLAVVIVPASEVPIVMEECGQKRIKGAIVISAGFKEIGERGRHLEKRIKEIADKYEIAMIGPNCFGMINTHPKTKMNATFGRIMPNPGNIAFISQSGAVGGAALEYCEAEEIGLSKFVSIGNKADISENELLFYLKDDETTKVILLYLEDLKEPKTFLEIAREITDRYQKPILAVKSGRTREGAKAASSHTGALAGSDEAYNAFFNQCGIIRLDNLNELFDCAKAFSMQPIPKSKKIAIVSNAGGIAIMATDAAIRNGLELASFRDGTKERLRKILPPTANIQNPVDVIGDADAQRYSSALKIVLEDEEVSGVIATWTPTLMEDTKAIARAIAEIAPSTEKPVIGCILSLEEHKVVSQEMEKEKVPNYRFPEVAAKILSILCEYGEWLNRPRTEIKTFGDVEKERVKEIISWARKRRENWLLEPYAYSLLAAYKIPVAPFSLIKSLSEAEKKAEEIGYPVVLKIVSPQIIHKFDVGGVILNIKDRAELKDAYERLLANVKARNPEAEIFGVLAQKMMKGGKEVILGMKRDPQFGSLLMFGMGGTYVEVLKDVSFRVAPIRELSAQTMVKEIRGYQILKGFRGERSSDIEKLVEVLERLSQLVTDFDEFEEIDINPFLVFEERKGAFAIDARIRLKE
ncbi:MAG: acetate--CoA ligase alpha subunit [candidate division WOR-3 bacterium]